MMATVNIKAQVLDEQGAHLIRAYLGRYRLDMTTAELIGCYRKLVDTSVSTDEEECALLDLLVPLS